MDIFLIVPIISGLVSGIVVNYLADVLPSTRRFSRPQCPHCNTEYNIAGYLSHAKCAQCGRPRSLRTWVTLAVMTALNVYTWISPAETLGYWPGFLLLGYFGLIFVIDLEHKLILHPTSIAGSILCFGLGWLKHGLSPTLIGGLAGFLIMLLLYYFGALFAKIRARRMRQAGQEADDEEALGAGDVILAGILGLLLGWPLVWFGLLLGILLGGLAGVLIMVYFALSRKYGSNFLMVFIPYGPFLITSATLIVFFPEVIKAVMPK